MHNRTAGRLLVAALAVAGCGPVHAATDPHPGPPPVVAPASPTASPTAVWHVDAAHAEPDEAELAEREAEARTDPFVRPLRQATDARCDGCPAVQPDPPRPVVSHAAPAPARALSSVPTTDPVVFLTIDDGEHWNEAAAQLLERARVPVTLFLTERFVADKYPQMRRLVAAGAWVEPHTATHPNLARAAASVAEVCGPLEPFTREFGRRGTLFRPPYGNPGAAGAVAGACGLHAVVLWRASTNGGALATQGGELRAGDIILMHFRPDLADNLAEVFRIVNDRGLRIGRLECYVGGDERCGAPWR